MNEVKLGVVLGFCAAACASTSASGPAAGPAGATKPAPVAEYGEIGPPQKSREPTTEADILKRLGESAGRVPPGKVAERITIGDIGYPGSVGQARAMGGMAVVLITAVTRDPGELPIVRALVRGEGVEADLPMLASRASSLADVDSAVARAFGLHRYDGLYIIPLALTRRETTIVVDFQANRTNYLVLRFPIPNTVLAEGVGDVPAAVPQFDVVEEYCLKEFPLLTAGTWTLSPLFERK